MPRFVLLHHDFPPRLGKPSHWDLMLEDDGVLITWALAEQPAAGGAGGSTIAATRLADHRLDYLDYEGPVSGDRGSVRRLDAGSFSWLERRPARVRIELDGETLSGEIMLANAQGNEWLFELRRGSGG